MKHATMINIRSCTHYKKVHSLHDIIHYCLFHNSAFPAIRITLDKLLLINQARLIRPLKAPHIIQQSFFQLILPIIIAKILFIFKKSIGTNLIFQLVGFQCVLYSIINQEYVFIRCLTRRLSDQFIQYLLINCAIVSFSVLYRSIPYTLYISQNRSVPLW